VQGTAGVGLRDTGEGAQGRPDEGEVGGMSEQGLVHGRRLRLVITQ